MDAAVDAFLDRLDEFASGLDPEEQAMLAVLLDADDTAGFGKDTGWPGARTVVAPIKLGSLPLLGGGPISGGDLGSGRVVGEGPISGTDLGSGR